MPAVAVEGLRKRYGAVDVVDGLSFTVDPGEIVALLGPNGAGKTTTVEICQGARRPDAGNVRVLDHDPARHLRSIRSRLGAMPQEAGLWASVRPLEALRLFAAFYPEPEDPPALLERVGLSADGRTTWRRLSGGQKQRLSLAIALVGRPQVAFLDEPTAGMDIHGRHATWELIAGLRERRAAVVLTTHLLEEAEQLADRVVILNRGRAVAEGAPGDIVRRSSEGVRVRTDGPIDVERLSTATGRRVIQDDAIRYRVEGAADPRLLASLTAAISEQGVLVRELVVGHRSLEEVFLELTRENA